MVNLQLANKLKFNKSHLIFSVVLLLVFFTGILLGKYIFKVEESSISNGNNRDQTDDLNELKSKLMMCENDEAYETLLQDSIYNDAQTGITSPLFKDLLVKNIMYQFKKSRISEINFSLKDSLVNVHIFTLKDVDNLPILNSNLVKENNVSKSNIAYDFPIFYAYEFANFVRPESYVSSWIPKSPIPQDIYINRHGIKMYRGIDFGPKCEDTAILKFSVITVKGKQTFVIISIPRQQIEPCTTSIQEKNYLYKELEKVADTIELLKYK